MNLVDSSGWLEFFADGPNADHFSPPLQDIINLIVPAICIYEVFVERYFLSHSLELADALISATAIVFGLPLATCSDKQYKLIKELEVIKFKI